MKKSVIVVIAALVAFGGYYRQQHHSAASTTTDMAVGPRSANNTQSSTTQLEQAFQQHQSNVPISLSGTVKKILSDDNDGSRHQRFIVAAAGHTILVAHNIDLAERVSDLQSGDAISLHGEYVWNAQGGIMHWTHRDPSGRHEAGWIEYKGHTYQ